MSGRKPLPDKRTEALQRQASDPGHSAWVSANAGSGKTQILAARVTRLLLGGVDPASILCLTYTNAAGANMADRVFNGLARWTSLDDGELARDIEKLMGAPPLAIDLARARRLFARAVETPGGLKIQTIHGFCERTLQVFPFEANVAGSFRVLDEREANALLVTAIDRALERGRTREGFADALVRVVGEVSEEDFRELMTSIVAKRRELFRAEAKAAAWRAADLATIAAAHDVAAGAKPADIARGYLAAMAARLDLPSLVDGLLAGGANDQKLGRSLAEALVVADAVERCEDIAALFLTKDGSERNRDAWISRKFGPSRDRVLDELVAERARYLVARDRLRGAMLVARTEALHRVASAVQAEYERAKADIGALDFNDLVGKTKALLERQSAAWVLHKLDRGVTHLLVDEAQDTSPEQWSVIAKLVEEFTAGEGARESGRTLFVVGDEKQSIYGFQGAEPANFSRLRALFDQRHRAARQAFEPVRIEVSFRSTPQVLAAVDAVFNAKEAHRGLVFETGVSGPPPHESLRSREAGFVELWPIPAPSAAEESADAFTDAGALEDEISPAEHLAQRIARRVAELIDTGDPTGRKVKPGDVMILVRRRLALFEATIRALKRADLPVAGADRLKLGQHIAVMDLVALGRAILNEEDDFALACALKSPFCGLDDDDLLAIAPERPGTLWRALQAAAASGRHAELAANLLRWRRNAANGPYAFYAGLLEVDGGRRAILARLGEDARDAIDAFLARALAHERDETPTLADFLARFEATAGEIKRDHDAAAGEIRVMTVHAAKGLEAPIVILPDTTTRPHGDREHGLVEIANESARPALAWAPRKEQSTAPIAAARKRREERQDDEQQRLLYVALTRAENGVIICGHAKARNAKPDNLVEARSWYELVEKGLLGEAVETRLMARLGKLELVGPADDRRLLWRGVGEGDGGADQLSIVPEPLREPDWLRRAITPEGAPAPPLRPSRAAEAADRLDRPVEPSPARRNARARGVLAHRLLETLAAAAPARRAVLAARLAGRHGGDLAETEREEIAASALRVLAEPALASLFGADGRSEVAVAGKVTLPNGRIVEVSGRIDRLAATDAELLIADFKTATPPARAADIAASSILQLALYRRLLLELAGDRTVRTLVVYVDGPVAFEIAPQQLEAALAAFTPK